MDRSAVAGWILLPLLVVRPLDATATAQSAKPDFGKAYSYALRCFVANGVAMPRAEDDPDGIATKASRDHARKAFDLAYQLGAKLGYPKSKVASDLDRAQGVEMRLMVQNQNYFGRMKAECATLGLM